MKNSAFKNLGFKIYLKYLEKNTKPFGNKTLKPNCNKNGTI